MRFSGFSAMAERRAGGLMSRSCSHDLAYGAAEGALGMKGRAPDDVEGRTGDGRREARSLT
jgi:hypothetical protein